MNFIEFNNVFFFNHIKKIDDKKIKFNKKNILPKS